MKRIWYLLKCMEGNETNYAEKCSKLTGWDGVDEIVCFRYQRMMRYGGKWHMEKRMALPGYVFLSGIINETNVKKILHREREDGQKDFIIPCEMPYLKELCQENNLIKMSRGIIRRGVTVVFSGPLKGRERLIQRIDRHKRTADIEIPFAGDKKQVTVGLEICEKETLRDRQ